MGRAAASSLLALAILVLSAPAHALVVELDDVAPDRIERQRAFARGLLPGPDAPDPETLKSRLAATGLVEGAPVLVRIFKLESELELWMKKGDAFVLQGAYPICHWTGTLGPKLREGDKQSPEGFYTIDARQMRHRGRWQRAFNLGFPNLHDKTLQRTGSYILVHGGCSSTGCYAMTEPAQREIHRLASAALMRGQARFQVHIFPFRMTEENLAAHADSPWAGFWRDLKAGYDAFEETHRPPRLSICGQRYVVTPADRRGRNDGPLTRIDAGKVAAAGLDPSICRIEPQPSGQQVATAPGQPAEAGAADEQGSGARPRSVFRVDRRAPATVPAAEEPPPPGWRPARPAQSQRKTPSRHRDAAAERRTRQLDKRRRADVDASERRNSLGAGVRRRAP